MIEVQYQQWMLCWSGWLRNAVNQKPVLNHSKDLQVLDKGLSFAPTPILPKQTSYLQLSHNFDRYANSLRIQHTRPCNSPTQAQDNTGITSTTTVFRPMNFYQNQALTNHSDWNQGTPLQRTTYKMQPWPAPSKHVQSKQNQPHKRKKQQEESLRKFKKSRSQLTINPADKKNWPCYILQSWFSWQAHWLWSPS